MDVIVLQYLELENLLTEAGAAAGLRVHVLERSKATSSNALSWREIMIGLCVQAITSDRRVLSWYGEIAKLGFYAHMQAGDASPEREQYQTAWQQARELQAKLVERLRQEGYIVYTDGLIELDITHFLRGVTGLIAWPEEVAREREGA
ncbi:MAG: hypothetical protein IPM39_09370 [Chloroflexi bacterium]|nr:hypothetical protein [Chloroflexota bacterium]